MFEIAKDHQILKVMTVDKAEYLKRWCHIRDLENAWGIFDQLVHLLLGVPNSDGTASPGVLHG